MVNRAVPGYGQSLAETVEARVQTDPDRVAVCTRLRTLTYAELNHSANRLARALIERCGEAAQPVALLLGEDTRLITAMLAVAKAGKFYVPLDPAHPPGRLANIIRSSGAAGLVADATCGGIVAGFENVDLPTLDIGVAGADMAEDDLRLQVPSGALAQLLFTSGSTGEPKGVMHSHRALMHTVYRHASSLAITAADRLTLLGARSSAQCMTGIWKALLNGSSLYPYKIRDEGLPGLADWLAANEITIYTSSASVFRYFGEMVDSSRSFPSLRIVQLGGEPIARHDFGLFQKRFPPTCVMVNTLSATECGSLRQNVLKSDATVTETLIPVGYPVPEVDVLLWDDEGREVPTGEAGELVVRSAYLADGYWRQPELSAAYFLPDPDGGDRRLFRTGDLGRIRADGCMEHLGRKDFCLKIRGNRVELAEIEAALLEMPGVKQQVVMAREDGPGEPRVVAYIVAGPERPTVPALRGHLARFLPDYMIPSAYVFMESLPTGPTGKVDRKALPPPGESATVSATRVAPRTLLETQLLGIWREELGIADFGIRDDFFDLGGNSLLANRMFHRVEQECGQRVVPANLLPGLTVERMAAEMVRSDRGSHTRTLLAEIQPGAPGRVPFFFVHADHESGGFYCRRLARHMGEDQPFYAFTPHGMDGGPIPPSIQDIAADHLRELLAFRPQGPYLLGGYCNGGLIAYEMAQQLRRRGVTVECVLMVDARAYNAPLLRTWQMASAIAKVFRLPQSAQLALFRRMRWWREDIRQAGLPRFLARKVARLAGSPGGAAPATGAVAAEVVDDAAAEIGGLWPAYHARVTLYVPDRYSGRVVLFRSSHVDQRPPGTWDAGWTPVASNFEVHRTPGNHRECLTTYAGELARAMRPYLDQYQAHAGA